MNRPKNMPTEEQLLPLEDSDNDEEMVQDALQILREQKQKEDGG